MVAGKRTRLIGLTASLAVAGALVAAPSGFAKAKGFELGVSAGDVTSSSAILWAKAKKSGEVEVQLTDRGGFGKCDPKDGDLTAKAKSSHDNTVQKKVKKLDPDTDYKYRFCMDGGAKSDTGKFTTAPDSKSKQTIRFALSGDQDARPEPGQSTPYWDPDFGVWKAVQKQKNDFNVLLGDTIYSDTEVPGYGLSDVALTTKQKWAAYKTNLAMKSWQKVRGSSAYYGGWDDHEFVNDFSPFEDVFPLSVGDVNIDGETLYKRGVDAFTDYNPITYKKKTGIYRTVRWGKNLEIFFLDDRSFRSSSSDYQGNCDNPPGSGDPDLAPTAPQSIRDVFGATVAPQLLNPVPPACTASINDPGRTMLGSKQLSKFKQDIANSSATFKVIFNQVPIQQYYALPYDRWEGYEAERQEVLSYLQKNVKNVVFLTTDVHANLVNDARFKTLEPGGPVNSGIMDITTGPIATAPFAEEINGTLGNPSGGTLIHNAFFKPAPPSGIGMSCAAMDVFSYAQVEVNKSQLTIDLFDKADAAVQDTGDAATPGPPCPQIVIPKQ